jgi:hypothetical protein
MSDNITRKLDAERKELQYFEQQLKKCANGSDKWHRYSRLIHSKKVAIQLFEGRLFEKNQSGNY